MWDRPNLLYGLLDKDYYEDFSAYTPLQSDFHDIVASRQPAGWTIVRQGIWFCCGSNQNAIPQQGWKIHVSATPANSREALKRVILVLFRRRDTNFKFVLDMNSLFLLNSKKWPRNTSGKFITIYPSDNRRFLDLIEEIDIATAGMRGPYILSDRRYKESRIVFYRYGGMQLYQVLNIKGERTPMLVGPNGIEQTDQRLPYPVTPEWAGQLLPVEQSQAEGHDLLGGRYLVQNVLAFSNSGGVYQALDQHTGKTVVIKEARPCVNATSDGYDAVELLKKEYRLLALLAPDGIAPQPVELFQEWEHWFLVEECFDGVSMAAHSSSHNVLLRTRPEAHSHKEWFETFRSLCVNLASIMEVLQRRNVIYGDLSTNNLMVLRPNGELKIIDFEGAYEVGVDRPAMLYTPGFVSGDRLNGTVPRFSDDHYSMGAVLLSYLFPLNGLFHLNPKAKDEVMKSIQSDARLPQGMASMILDLMDPNPACRPTPARVLEIATSASGSEKEPRNTQEPESSCESVKQGIVTHLNQVASYDRRDRLFPSDPKIFATNPLSLAYGASGVAYALHKASGQFPQRAVDWLLSHQISREAYPPGFYVGLAGIAVVLLELGARKEAEKIMQTSFGHRLLYTEADIFYGTAGWGMANLRFFLDTGDELYLDKAKQAGEHLLQTSCFAASGRYWETLNEVHIGFAHGASGIALFLLYLYLAVDDDRFLQAGREGLDFDLAHARETKDGGLSWPHTSGVESPLYPYWRTGSAGIGTTVLRFHRLLREQRYQSILERIFIDVDRRYTVSPGRFAGMAGLGDSVLDMYEFSGERRYLHSAREIAKSIMRFRVDRNGCAFPGDLLARLCCDFGTGSAGVALFLNRMLGRQAGDFTLDALFDWPACPARSLPVARAA